MNYTAGDIFPSVRVGLATSHKVLLKVCVVGFVSGASLKVRIPASTSAGWSPRRGGVHNDGCSVPAV